MIAQIATPCREWQGLRNRDGYGVRRVARFPTKLVHRQVWIMAYGPIDATQIVRHHCDNRACYRLDHLALGTQADNLADMDSRGRRRVRFTDVTHCIHGHEFTPENTYHWHGHRSCRACRRSHPKENP